MAAELKPGDRVRVVIDGTVRHQVNGVVHIRYGAQLTKGDRLLSVVTTEPGVTVEYLAPAEWPPRAGDLWHDRAGDPWFAAQADFDEPIRMIGRGGIAYPDDPDVLLGAWGPMTLVHRQAEAEDGDR